MGNFQSSKIGRKNSHAANGLSAYQSLWKITDFSRYTARSLRLLDNQPTDLRRWEGARDNEPPAIYPVKTPERIVPLPRSAQVRCRPLTTLLERGDERERRRGTRCGIAHGGHGAGGCLKDVTWRDVRDRYGDAGLCFAALFGLEPLAAWFVPSGKRASHLHPSRRGLGWASIRR